LKINKRGTSLGKMSNSREIMAVVKILLQAWLNHDKRRDMKWWINQCFLWNFECFKKSLTVIKLTLFYSRCSTNDLPKPKFDWNFSNSLIIHGRKQRKSLAWQQFGYMLLIIIKLGEPLLWISLTIILMLWEAISNTQKSVSSDTQMLHSLLKKTQLHLVFSIHFAVFGYLMKYSLYDMNIWYQMNNNYWIIIWYGSNNYLVSNE